MEITNLLKYRKREKQLSNKRGNPYKTWTDILWWPYIILETMATKIRRRYILLTYPQCDIDTRIIRDMLLEKSCLKEDISYLCIGEEDHHATDGVHRHVFIALTRERRIKKDEVAYGFDICRRTFYLEGQSTEHYDMYVHYMETWYNEQMVTMACGKELEWNTLSQKSSIRRWHPNFEASDGDLCSPKRMWIYTRKDHKYIEHGESPFKEKDELQDKATRNMLLYTKPLEELVREGYISILALPQLKKARQLLQNEYVYSNTEKILVYWYFGETGCGKSKAAREEAKKRYPNEDWRRSYWVLRPGTHSSSGWFDEYEGQPCAIFDDLRASTMPWNTLLQVTDIYQDAGVPIKGGFTRWNPKLIIITSAGLPREVFKDKETGEPWDSIGQLERRISECRRFYRGDNGEYCSELINLNQQ